MEFEFDDFTCIQFSFKNERNDILLFFTATTIFEFNYTAK